jgi:hypothetical protein
VKRIVIMTMGGKKGGGVRALSGRDARLLAWHQLALPLHPRTPLTLLCKQTQLANLAAVIDHNKTVVIQVSTPLVTLSGTPTSVIDCLPRPHAPH